MSKKICKFCGSEMRTSFILGPSKAHPAWRCTKCGTVLPRVLTAAAEAGDLLRKHSFSVERACKDLAADGMFEVEVEAVLIWLHPKGRTSAIEKVRNLTYWLETIYDRMRFAQDHPISRAVADMWAFCQNRNIDYDELGCC